MDSIFLFLVSGPKAFEQTLTISGMLLMMVIFGTFGPKTCELRSLRLKKEKKSSPYLFVETPQISVLPHAV